MCCQFNCEIIRIAPEFIQSLISHFIFSLKIDKLLNSNDAHFSRNQPKLSDTKEDVVCLL